VLSFFPVIAKSALRKHHSSLLKNHDYAADIHNSQSNYALCILTPSMLRRLIEEYCANSTIHGLQFITERGRHWSERLDGKIQNLAIELVTYTHLLK
jgi:hypothetical protein